MTDVTDGGNCITVVAPPASNLDESKCQRLSKTPLSDLLESRYGIDLMVASNQVVLMAARVLTCGYGKRRRWREYVFKVDK
jgi:hypothetical protein